MSRSRCASNVEFSVFAYNKSSAETVAFAKSWRIAAAFSLASCTMVPPEGVPASMRVRFDPHGVALSLVEGWNVPEDIETSAGGLGVAPMARLTISAIACQKRNTKQAIYLLNY